MRQFSPTHKNTSDPTVAKQNPTCPTSVCGNRASAFFQKNEKCTHFQAKKDSLARIFYHILCYITILIWVLT
jgi:hypothetical protein